MRRTFTRVPWLWPAVPVLAAALSGCLVGPDFKPTREPAAQAYLPGAQPAETAAAAGPGGEAQRIRAGDDVPAQWWALFRSETLDRLVRQALEESPTLAQMRARLVQAQEELKAQTGARMVYEFIDRSLADKSGAANVDHGTLTATDLTPAWRGPGKAPQGI